MKKSLFILRTTGLFLWCMIGWYAAPIHASIPTLKKYDMMSTPDDKEERKQVAKAILELHDLYISTGEAKMPMTISLPDLSKMAELSQEATERILMQFIDEKIIQTEKSAISILKKRKLKKTAGYWTFF